METSKFAEVHKGERKMMKNKKGSLGMIVGFLFLGFAILSISLSNIPNNSTCEYSMHKIQSINGMTDANSGLFSGGDVASTTLLMEDGNVFTFRKRFNQLTLGANVQIKQCESIFGDKLSPDIIIK